MNAIKQPQQRQRAGQAHPELERCAAECTAEFTSLQVRLQTVLDSTANVSVIAGTTEGLITIFNAGAENMLGYTSNEIVGKQTPAIFHLESEVMARGLELTAETGRQVQGFDVFVERARHGQHEEREWTYVRKDGSHLTVNLAVTGLLDADGTIIGFLGVGMDMSARVKAEAAFRASEERLRLMIDAVEDYALLMLDAGGYVISWNTGAERMKGYRAAEILGRHFSCFYSPEAIASGHPDEELRIAAQQGRYTEEGWRLRKDGSRFWADVLITAIHDDAGKLRGFAKVTRDITARKTAEKSLRDQALILDLANDSIFIRDSEDRIRYWNQGAQRLYGWSKEEALGHVTHTFLQTRFPQSIDAIQAQLLAQGHWEGELVHTRRDGSLVTVASGWTLQPEDSDRSFSVLEINYDITARRKVERELETSRKRLNAIFSGSLDGVIVFEAIRDEAGVLRDFQFAMVNPAAERMIGVDASTLIGRGLLEKFPISAAQDIFGKLARTVQQDIAFDEEYSSLCRGVPVWYRIAGVRLGDGAVLNYTDITARKQGEYQVESLARRLGLATDALHAGIWDWDLRTGLVLWDERMYRIYGIPKHSPIDYKAWATAVVPEDLPRTEAILQSVIGSKSQGSMEFRIRLPDGSIRYIQAAQGTVLDDAGQVVHVVGVNIDTTEQKLTEIRERQAAERLKVANKELEEFVYVASHDLKAPLRVIENASRWLEEDLQEYLTDDARESMNLLRGRVRRMEKLLDDLLEYARIGYATDDRYAETVSGSVLMDNILKLLPLYGFTLKVSPGFATIQVRMMPLQHILMNLIGNAVKHHHRKEGCIEVTVEDRGAHYAFAVTDDGPGIPAQFHEQIFKMFRTLRPRDQVEGSGMGLAFVRKNIEIFGGTLQLESAEGQGSTFRFTWPKVQSPISEPA